MEWDGQIKSKDGQQYFQMQMENDHRCWILVKTAKEGGYEAWARDTLQEFFFVVKIYGHSLWLLSETLVVSLYDGKAVMNILQLPWQLHVPRF